MEPSMNENGKRASGYPEENGVKRSRTIQDHYPTEDVRLLERRVGLLEQLCAGMQQEMAAMRLQLKHVEKRASSNHSSSFDQQSVPKESASNAVIDVDSDSSHAGSSEQRQALQVPVSISTERHTSPPSPNPPRTSYYNNSSILLQPPSRSQYDNTQNPHHQQHHVLSRQNSSSLASSHAHTPVQLQARQQSLLHSRMSQQTLRSLTLAHSLAGSLPQTLTVSPIPIPPNPLNKATAGHKMPSAHPSPALNPIKEEVPPFRPPLPYFIDDDISIQKETKKNKHASPLVYDVEESPAKYIIFIISLLLSTISAISFHLTSVHYHVSIDAILPAIPESVSDEVMVVGARQGANLPHSRYYCPNNKFTFPSVFENSVLEKPLGNNTSYCQDCFCYVCDCKASECKFWSTPDDGAVHCNAHAIPFDGWEIWKQLRVVHRNPLFIQLHRLYQEKNPIESRKYVETELTSDITRAVEVASLEPRASELSSALEFYHDQTRRARPCVCDCHTSDLSDSDGDEDGCWKCEMFHGWITIHSIMERLADDIKGCLCADDLSSLTGSPGTSRRLAQAAVSLDILTEKLSTATWRRADADLTAENLFKNMVKRLCFYWIELLLDAEFTPEVRATAALRLRRLADASTEPCFRDQMQLAVAIGEKGWDYPDLQRIASGQPPPATSSPDEAAMLPVCLRVLYRAKQWDKLFAFLKYAGQKGVLGSSQLLPLAMARVGQFHEAVNWCFQHMNQLRFNLLLEVGSTITDIEEPNEVIVYAAFRLGVLALHKALRREYAPGSKPDLACWLVRALSGRGLTAAQLAERNTPGPPTPRLQSVRQTATRIFTFEEQRILGVLRGGPPDGGSRAGLASMLGVEEALIPHVMLEISLLLCIGALDMYEVGRVADVLKKNDDMFGIISLAFHMPQDQEAIMNFVVANVLPKMGTAAAPGLVEKWITNPNISDFLLVQFVALFIKEGNTDRAFAIGERIVATHKAKSSATRFSTYCAMTKLAELLWPLAIDAGKLELAKTLAQSTFDEAPSWKNLELLQKSYSEQEWPARREQLLGLIRTGQAPYVAIPSVRRLELLARSGRFADAAAVLQETSSSSPEEAGIISDVLRDLKKHSPEKIEEFAKSILPWLEMMTYRGYADDIWMQLVPTLPQFCIAMITKFQEQLEEQFDRKTVQENDRRLMIYIEGSNEAAWNNRMRRLVSGPLRRKSALMTSIKATGQLFDRFPSRNGEQPAGATSPLPFPPSSSSSALSSSREGLNNSSGGLNTSATGINSSATGINSSVTGINSSATGINVSVPGLSNTGILLAGLNLNTSATGLNTSAIGLNASTISLNTSATNVNSSTASTNSLRNSNSAVNLSGSGIITGATNLNGSVPSLQRSTSSSLPGFGRLTPVPVSAPLTVSPQTSRPPNGATPQQRPAQRLPPPHPRSPNLLSQSSAHAPLSPTSPQMQTQRPQGQPRHQSSSSSRQPQLSPARVPSSSRTLNPKFNGHNSQSIPLPLSPSRSPQPASPNPSPTPPLLSLISPTLRPPSSPHLNSPSPSSQPQDKNMDIHLFQHFVTQLPNGSLPPPLTLPPPSNSPLHIPAIRIPSLDISQNGYIPPPTITSPSNSNSTSTSPLTQEVNNDKSNNQQDNNIVRPRSKTKSPT